jgi:hypothetical protein
MCLPVLPFSNSKRKLRFMSCNTRRVSALLFPFLLLSPILRAQTAAQRALANEPESRQINDTADNLRDQQGLPNNDVRKPSLAGMALNSFTGIRTQQALLDRLEARIDEEARACHFCASKQDELSELIRERVAFQQMVADISRETGSGAGQFLMDTTSAPTRWQDRKIAIQETSSALREHCNQLKDKPDEVCKDPDGVINLTGKHEKAWAQCFNRHNWVENSSDRIAYEACMNSDDPLTKLCIQDNKGSAHEQNCPHFTVNYADVYQLKFYRDRWDTDPHSLPAAAVIIPGQATHVKLLEPIVVPPACTGAPADKPQSNCLPPDGPGSGFSSTVRGRLENSLEGEYASNLNPTTAGVAAFKPSILDGLSGHVILVPAGTEVPVGVKLSWSPGAKAQAGYLALQIVTSDLNNPPDVKHNQLISQDISRYLPWPAGGTVLFPANSSISFATQCGCPYSMSVSEYRKRAANASAAAKPTFPTRVILVGSRIQTVLLDPLDAAGIQAGKNFHAQLNVDMELPRGSTRDDFIKLPRGTDVYLKVFDRNVGTQFAGHNYWVSVDYAIVNGQKVHLNTPPWPLGFSPQFPGPGRSGRPPANQVIWPVGTKTWWDIAEQAEASTDGLQPGQVEAVGSSSESTQESTQVTDGTAAHPAAAPASTQSAAAPGQAATAAAAPEPATVPRSTAPQPQASREQQLADRKKLAQEYMACQQQALRDHPERGAALARAYSACVQGLHAK